MIYVFGDSDIGPIYISTLETANFFKYFDEKIDHLID